jgi:hypothetical protein
VSLVRRISGIYPIGGLGKKPQDLITHAMATNGKALWLFYTSPIELHLPAKKPLLSPTEISRIYAAVLCLSCTLRP